MYILSLCYTNGYLFALLASTSTTGCDVFAAAFPEGSTELPTTFTEIKCYPSWRSYHDANWRTRVVYVNGYYIVAYPYYGGSPGIKVLYTQDPMGAWTGGDTGTTFSTLYNMEFKEVNGYAVALKFSSSTHLAWTDDPTKTWNTTTINGPSFISDVYYEDGYYYVVENPSGSSQNIRIYRSTSLAGAFELYTTLPYYTSYHTFLYKFGDVYYTASDGGKVYSANAINGEWTKVPDVGSGYTVMAQNGDYEAVVYNRASGTTVYVKSGLALPTLNQTGAYTYIKGRA